MISATDTVASRLRGYSTFIEVYELELDAGTLRYAPSSLSWGGNAYTQLAVRRDMIEESLAFEVPRCRVQFSNVTHTLRAQFAPTDLLTGKRAKVRLLTGDASGTLDADSVVLFGGVIEEPEQISESDFAVSIVGVLESYLVSAPRRTLSPICSWDFPPASTADLCGYDTSTGETTASGAGTDSTALTVGDASNLAIDDWITIGSGAEVQITNVSGSNVTLAEARTWSASDVVAFSRCSRRFPDCVKRAQEHRYGGFLGIASVSRINKVAPGTVQDGRLVDVTRGF